MPLTARPRPPLRRQPRVARRSALTQRNGPPRSGCSRFPGDVHLLADRGACRSRREALLPNPGPLNRAQDCRWAMNLVEPRHPKVSARARDVEINSARRHTKESFARSTRRSRSIEPFSRFRLRSIHARREHRQRIEQGQDAENERCWTARPESVQRSVGVVPQCGPNAGRRDC